MFWTYAKIAKAQEILSRHRDLNKAHKEIQDALVWAVSKDSVRNAFRRSGLESPGFWLGTAIKRLNIQDFPAENIPGTVRDMSFWTPEMVEHFNTMDPFIGRIPKAQSAVANENGKVSRIVVVSDLHVPYHDVRAWECVLETIRQTKPEIVVIIGDFCDAYAVSSHPKSLDRKADFAGEIRAVNVELDRLMKASGSARMVYCAGNHEDRIERYLQSKAPELAGFAGMRSDGLLRIKERGIEWVPYRRHIKIGNCSFTHDVGRCGVSCARQSLIDFGGNLVIGHSHRGGISCQGEGKGSSHFCLNVGWLGDVEGVDYIHQIRAKRDWQCGFGIVDQDESGYSWANFIPIIDGKCIVDGKVIGGRLSA